MAHPKSQEAKQSQIDTNPFDGMLINDANILNELNGRNPCPKCGKSRKYFCYTCYVPITELQGKLPQIKLPIKIDIIKHKNEIDGKSTASHAALLAPEHVTIYTYPDIPDYKDDNVVLIFPSSDARTIIQLINNDNNKVKETNGKGHHTGTLMKHIKECEQDGRYIKCPTNELPIKRAVFIDSTWNQSRGIYKDDRIRNIPCVVIHNRISQFWRHQKGSPRWYLATIEAIHQFLLEIHICTWGVNKTYTGVKNCFSHEYLEECEALKHTGDLAYNGQYDNLLYFFRHMYDLIHAYYDHDQLYAYKRRLM